MTRISEEIRTWCSGVGTVKDLRALADRIDSETVELPKDAEGVPIHVGDTVYGCRSGMKMTIKELRMTTDGWFVSTSSGYITDTTVTHDLPDSCERIADELDEMVDAACSADDRCKKLADLAERIRRQAKREGE